jgi:tRNA threonylcarbamoyladenosine biosynthesis protein TsaB
MALILSIETSTSVCSVALHKEGKLISYQSLFVARSHAEYLLSIVEHALEVSQYTAKDLQAIAISEGPGSYTGLRIGASTATGLCYALDISLIAINTLEAMSLAIKPFNFNAALCCPMIDARRMEVYCLITDAAGNVLEKAHPHIIAENSFSTWLDKGEVFFFGDGAEKCKPTLSSHKNAIFIDNIYPSAEHIGMLAYQKFQQNKLTDISAFSPVYLKPFQSNIVISAVQKA